MRLFYVDLCLLTNLGLNGNTNLGIFWAYEKEAAQQYFGDSGNIEVLMQCTVPNSGID